MKTIGFLILSLFFLIFSGFQQSDRKAKKLQKEKETIELIESGHFRFVVNSAMSSLGNFDHLDSSYNMAFDSLKIKAYLPYYGRAYSVPYGGREGGVNFDLMAEKIDKVWKEKKKLFEIFTEVADSKDSYSIYLTVGASSYADMKISFRNREAISYSGIIEKLKKE